MHAHRVAHVLQHQTGNSAIGTLHEREEIIDCRTDLITRRRISQQLNGRMHKTHRRNQVPGTVPGAIERADSALGIARIDGQSPLEVLMTLVTKHPDFDRPQEDALKRRIGGTLQDVPHRLLEILGKFLLTGCTTIGSEEVQLMANIVRNRPALEYVGGRKYGGDWRFAAKFSERVEVSEG